MDIFTYTLLVLPSCLGQTPELEFVSFTCLLHDMRFMSRQRSSLQRSNLFYYNLFVLNIHHFSPFFHVSALKILHWHNVDNGVGTMTK